MTKAGKALQEAAATVEAMIQDGVKTFSSDQAMRAEIIRIAAEIIGKGG